MRTDQPDPTKLQNIPGQRRRGNFAQVEYAGDIPGTLKRLAAYFLNEKLLLLKILLVTAFSTLCGVSAPALQSRAIDILAGELPGRLFPAVLAMLFFYLLYSAGGLLLGILSAYLGQHIVGRLRSELFGRMIRLKLAYLDSHPHGDLISRMSNDAENISNVISQALPSLLSGILTVLGTAAVMLFFCWQLALLSFATIFLTIGATRFLSGQVRKFSRRRQSLLGQLNAISQEMILSYHTVIACDRQDSAVKDFCRMADSLTKAGIRTDVFSGVMGPVMNCISNIGFVIIAVMGGYFCTLGLLSVGVISAFIVYAKQFSKPINEIAQVWGQIQTAIAGAERIFAVLDEKEEEAGGNELSCGESAQISFQNVSFSYVPGHPVIRDFSLSIPKGSRVALVGATGSGKTTIINLLLRFYETDAGCIRIDGQDIRTASLKSLRRQTAIVLQDTMLLSGTILDNLCYAGTGISEEALNRAIDASRCRELINGLPLGLQTEIGGSWDSLSQGERQLLAIARALAANPKILILDEATSNVDTRTEKRIQDAMHDVTHNRTSILIAHRLSTIRDADRIVVMDNGRIVETGTHETLLKQKGKYYELCMAQFAGYRT